VLKCRKNKVEITAHNKYSFVCSDSIIGLGVVLWLFVAGYDCPCSVEWACSWKVRGIDLR